MTESEWQACADPQKMLDFIHKKTSDRKLRLFAVACCKSVWNLLRDKRERKVVKLSELLADGLATEEEFRQAVQAAGRVASRSPPSEWGRERLALWYLAGSTVRPCLCDSGEALRNVIRESTEAVSVAQSLVAQSLAEIACHPCDLLRDIFGLLPFHTIAICSDWLAWNDATVPKMAQAMYEERSFDWLPILADALEEAGCMDRDILGHCRGPGEHVRGCWVVDLILGKS